MRMDFFSHFLSAWVALAQPSAPSPPPAAPEPAGPPAQETVTLLRVVDGDTLFCRGKDGERFYVRLLLIDACEPGQGDPGRMARDKLTEWVSPGMFVGLVRDPAAGRDPYGRVLAYVYVPGLYVPGLGRASLNEHLAYAGLAFWWCPEAHAALRDEILEAETSARMHMRGLWGREGGVEFPWAYRKRKRAN